MAIELHVTGPGLDTRRLIVEAGAEVTLGRDAECDICLPDPQRNVSRRHLAVSCVDGELHFHVVSVVNGVDLPFGEAPPGARGVLPVGQTLKVGEYHVVAGQAIEPPTPPASTEAADPWAVFDRDGSGIAPVPAGLRAPPSLPAGAPPLLEEDPFGDWGFESTFGPGSRAGPSLEMEGAGAIANDLAAFFQGLGLDPAKLGPMSPGELETIGRLVRQAMQGLLELHATRAHQKREARAEDRTLMAGGHDNPLQREDWPIETRLQYLLGGRGASVGFIHPERALGEVLAELKAHEQAADAAARAAVLGVLDEFAPETLRQRLLGDGPTLFEGARMWAAYSRFYGEQSGDIQAWVQLVFDKYFTETYVKEVVRLQRETKARAK